MSIIKLKRYELDSETRYFYEDAYEVHLMVESSDGEYVKFADLTSLQKRIKELGAECADYKKVLLYCKHNKTGQGSRINGVLWQYSDDC